MNNFMIIISFLISLNKAVMAMETPTEAKGQPPSPNAHQKAIRQAPTLLSLIQKLIAASDPDEQKEILVQMDSLPERSRMYRNKVSPLKGMTVDEYERLFKVLLNPAISLPPITLNIVVRSFKDETRNEVVGSGRFEAPNATLFFISHLDFEEMSRDYWIKFYEKASDFLLTAENFPDFIRLLDSPSTPVNLTISLLKALFEDPNCLTLIKESPISQESNVSNLDDAKNIVIRWVLSQSPDSWAKNARIIIQLKKQALDLPAETKAFFEEEKQRLVLDPLLRSLSQPLVNQGYSTHGDRLGYFLGEEDLTDNLALDIFKTINNLLVSDAPLEYRISVFQRTFFTIMGRNPPPTLVKGYTLFLISNVNQKGVKETLNGIENSFERLLTTLSPDAGMEILTLLETPAIESDMKANHEWLYEKIRLAIATVLKRPYYQESVIRPVRDRLPTLYAAHIDQFSRMIFSDIPGISRGYTNAQSSLNLQSTNLQSVIYNQTGYDEGMTFKLDASHKKGRPLIDAGTPIGYNIHLPKDPVKAIFVKIYGGYQAKDRKEKMFIPGKLNTLEYALLDRGIAVVTLNLVDLRDLNVFQDEMPEELHHRLHQSIHTFLDKIKTVPQELEDSLENLKGKPVYLYGASFGGRTAIRHAELYPDDCDGYISHDGSLSPAWVMLSDLKDVAGRSRYNFILAPDSRDEIEKITKPILLLHNFDDNNVNIKVTCNFAEYAQKILGNKAHIQVLFTGRGNPMPETSHNKGHFIPTNKEDFERYVDTVSTFILKGGSKLSTFSDWRIHACTLYANKYYRSGTLIEKFVSEAFRLYHATLSEEHKGVSPADIRIRHENAAQKAAQQEAWEAYYAPLYLAMTYVEGLTYNPNKLDAEIERLKQQGVLTDEVIDRTLTKQLPLFFDYLKERENIPIDLPTTGTDVSKFLTPELRDAYRSLITRSGKDDEALFLLSALYMANPDLTPKMAIDQDTMGEAKKTLFKAVDEEGEKIRSVWQQAAQKHPELVAKKAGKKILSNWRKRE